MASERRDVTFFSPLVGEQVRPLGLEGPGTLEWNEAGVLLTGHVRSQAAAMVFSTVGVVLGLTLGVVVVQATGLPEFTALVTMLGGAALGVLLSKQVVKPRVKTFSVPWVRVANLNLDGALPCFVSMDEPSGSVCFALGTHRHRPRGNELLADHRALVEQLQKLDDAVRAEREHGAGKMLGE